MLTEAAALELVARHLGCAPRAALRQDEATLTALFVGRPWLATMIEGGAGGLGLAMPALASMLDDA